MCPQYSVYIQRVVLVPSIRIFLVQESSQLRGRKIIVLGRSQHNVNCISQEDPSTRDESEKMAAGRPVSNHGIKGPPWHYYELIFVIALGQSRSKESRRGQITVLFLLPAMFNFFSIRLYLDTARTKISVCRSRIFLLPGSSSLNVNSPLCQSQPMDPYGHFQQAILVSKLINKLYLINRL